MRQYKFRAWDKKLKKFVESPRYHLMSIWTIFYSLIQRFKFLIQSIIISI